MRPTCGYHSPGLCRGCMEQYRARHVFRVWLAWFVGGMAVAVALVGFALPALVGDMWASLVAVPTSIGVVLLADRAERRADRG